MGVAGGKTTSKIDGVSLRPLLEGKSDLSERALFWHYPHYGNQGGAPGAAIRRGDWKLIWWFEKLREPEPYNLRDDLSETQNLTKKEPKRVKDMLTELRDWQKDVGALMPQVNPAYDPAKPNGREAKRPLSKSTPPCRKNQGSTSA
jgi:arylsulfatase A-like enzyme